MTNGANKAVNKGVNKEVSATCYSSFTAFLQSHSGIVLGDAKQYLVRSRLSSLLHQYQFDDINDLIQVVISGRNPTVTKASIDVMTTNETLWFRDGYPFDLLKSHVFPELVTRSAPIKIWSAACSSGQEPYSIAMTYKEYIQANRLSSFNVKLVATDLSFTMIDKCRNGVYDELALSRGGLTAERRSQFFDRQEDSRLVVKQDLKQLIEFKIHNLIEGRGMNGPYDIIFCRNVLIYFSAEIKSKILQHFAASLSPGGILFLGASESIGTASKYFSMVRCSSGLYYQLKSL